MLLLLSALNTLSMHAQRYFLKISVENFFVFWMCIVHSNSIFFLHFTPNFEGVYYTQVHAIHNNQDSLYDLRDSKNFLISYN